MLKKKSQPSLSSIKEALDDLDSGICFADRSGRIVLINHVMSELSFVLCGRHPQTAEEIMDALKSPPEASGIKKLEKEGLYSFQDGRIWDIEATALDSIELMGYTRIKAQDLTKIYEAQQELARENQALKAVNAELSQMLERLTDHIREEETLALNRRLHNDIAGGLSEISAMLEGSEEDISSSESTLKRLSDAMSYFRSDAWQAQAQEH